MKIDSINTHYNLINEEKALKEAMNIQKEFVEQILHLNNKIVKMDIQEKVDSQKVDTLA